MKISEETLRGLKVTVMGLGLHGGGVSTAKYLASRGAVVTVTDLLPRERLTSSLDALEGFDISYTLGEHRMEDFAGADMVVKNPGVSRSSPYLKKAKLVESDISLFLKLNKHPIVAITGSKGKSTTSSLLYHIIKPAFPGAELGGNITISPLTFLEKGTDEWNKRNDPVVLELSSWQLADVANRGILKPRISVVTNIMRDHQDRYATMDEYVQDKRAVFLEQESEGTTLCPLDDPYGPQFARETPARPLFFSGSRFSSPSEGAWLTPTGGGINLGSWIDLLPKNISLPGEHNRLNSLISAVAAYLLGVDPVEIANRIASFSGIPHRLQHIRTWRGIRFFNDSTATIPEAAAASIGSFDDPVFLIVGGNDKEVNLPPLIEALPGCRGVFILNGSGSERLLPMLQKHSIEYAGPFDSLGAAFRAAVDSALTTAGGGESPVVLLSPGFTSFGMFLNEFDRGNRFVELVNGL